MGTIKDLTGIKFGSLTVVGYIGKRNGKSVWRCKCDCGNETESMTSNLTRGLSTSCGCKRKKTCSDRMKAINYKHGGSRTRLFRIWSGMKSRCFDKNDPAYPRYGGRGVKVCDEWKENFPAFQQWALSSGYSEVLSIDRINVNGGYCPENCRWATREEQANNKRTNRFITYGGKTMTISQWERSLGYRRGLILVRLKNGWSVERAIREDPNSHKGVIA